MTFTEALRSPPLKQAWPWIFTSLPVFVLLQYQAVAPVGHWLLLILQLPYFLALAAAAAALFALPVLAILENLRGQMLAWLLASVVYLTLGITGIVLGHRIRAWGFDQFALRSAPLVAAVHAYHKKHGEPPASLKDLVPDHLPKVPRTGIMAYPRYDYFAGPEAQKYAGNPWVLIVQTPAGGSNGDLFLYFPLQNYPTTGYGGWIETVRDWAYVHE